MQFISPEYRDLNCRLHKQAKKYGISAQRYIVDIRNWLKIVDAEIVLDYGCGKGKLKQGLRNQPVTVYEYDPCILDKAGPPGPADVVVCIDVLEHIEPEYLDSVLEHMRTLALKGLFVTVSTTQGKRRLPDGSHVHINVHSFEFWENKLGKAFGTGSAQKVERKNTVDGIFKWEFGE